MTSAIENRISVVRPSWIGSPLIVQPSRRSVGSSSSARHDPRADRAEPGHRLAEQPLVAVEPRVARRDVVDDRVAEDVRRPGTSAPPMTTPSSHSASTLAVSDRSQPSVAPWPATDARQLAVDERSLRSLAGGSPGAR